MTNELQNRREDALNRLEAARKACVIQDGLEEIEQKLDAIIDCFILAIKEEL